jgi:predicted ArsR family transcriptional regulator
VNNRNPQLSDQLDGIASLRDPVRRRLYLYVAGNSGDVTRDEAAQGVGISRGLAAFHLDKLVGEGLLSARFQRLSGRTGPGAGRPSKLYRRSDAQFDITLPPRSYELAARLFAEALDSGRPEESGSRLEEVAHRFGVGLGERACQIEGAGSDSGTPMENAEVVLAGYGFEPFQDEDGATRLRNCPFHALAQRHRSLVCGMNLSIMRGLTEALGDSGHVAVLEPHPGMCCVAFRAVDQS